METFYGVAVMKQQNDSIVLSRSSKDSYKLLMPLSVIIITISLSTLVLGYKVISVHGYIFSGAALVIPFRYMLGDIIAEVYGLSAAKKVIWMLVVCGLLFSLIGMLAIKLPSPNYWTHAKAYNFVLGNMLPITIDGIVGVFTGSMLNVFLLSKWKLLLKGKWFFLRSVSSSICGELTQYIIVLSMMYWKVFGAHKISELIALDYSIQVVFLLLLAPIASVLIFFIKRTERVDVYEESVSFNPFNISNAQSK